MLDQSRINTVRALFDRVSVDAILFYSTSFDFRYTRFLLGEPCWSPLQYLLVDRELIYLFEPAYRIEGSKIPDVHFVGIEEENAAGEVLRPFLRPYQNLGIVRDVPGRELIGYTGEVLDITRHIDELLKIKKREELQSIARGARILAEAIATCGEACRPGASDFYIREIFENSLRKHPIEGFSFPTSVITRSGLISSTVSVPTGKHIEEEDLVLVDAGIIVDGLHSDCTRLFPVGNSVLSQKAKIFVALHNEVIREVTIGMTFKEILTLLEKKLRRHGFENHSLETTYLGHSVGFALHESPFFVRSDSYMDEVSEGMVFTLEPEITVEGVKLRVEDMLAVEDGNVRVLT